MLSDFHVPGISETSRFFWNVRTISAQKTFCANSYTKNRFEIHRAVFGIIIGLTSMILTKLRDLAYPSANSNLTEISCCICQNILWLLPQNSAISFQKTVSEHQTNVDQFSLIWSFASTRRFWQHTQANVECERGLYGCSRRALTQLSLETMKDLWTKMTSSRPSQPWRHCTQCKCNCRLSHCFPSISYFLFSLKKMTDR